MRVAVIYAFRSPGSGAVYIGKHECDPEGWPRRGSGRLPDGYRGSGVAVANFHAKHGAAVQWRILAIVPLADWPRAERRAIRLARALLGNRCVNKAEGGDGLGSDLARKVSRQMWSNPEQAERTTLAIREANNRPEMKARRSADSIALWADPDYASRATTASSAAQRRPEVRAKHSSIGKVRVQTPEGAATLARAHAAGQAPASRARAAATLRINNSWRRLERARPELFG